MNKIKISCTSGMSLPMEKIIVYPGHLKKHSQLEIDRLCDSIISDGFLFPIAIGRVKDKNYVVDGECRIFALQELECRGYEIPEIPIFYVKSNFETIKKNIIAGTSVNHCVTECSLTEFCKDSSNINLKQFAFSTPDLIDFHDDVDIGLYIYTIGGKFSEQEVNKLDFEGLLK